MNYMDNDIDAIRDALAAVLDNGMTGDELSPDADIVTEYGIDSLQMISFLLNIEDTFDIELDYDNLELDDLRSVREFAGYVAGLRTNAPAL
jgi:acyl carrier protein